MSALLVGLLVLLLIALLARWQWLATRRFQIVGRRRLRAIVPAGSVGVLIRDGVPVRVWEPGRHDTGWALPWSRTRYSLTVVPTRTMWLNSGDVDVLSADQLPYRLRALIGYAVTDPLAYAVDQAGAETELRLAVAQALHAMAGERDVVAMQRDREAHGAALLERVGQPVANLRLESATIDAVTLPPELRKLFVEVERARLEGLAALERARGEQAALRSLANAARLLKDNPELARLRLLQTVRDAKGSTLVLHADGAPDRPERGTRESGT